MEEIIIDIANELSMDEIKPILKFTADGKICF
jgi:hypothetical protein